MTHLAAHARAAFGFALALLGPAAAAPDNFTEEAWQIKAPSCGCKSQDDYSRLMDFILSGDGGGLEICDASNAQRHLHHFTVWQGVS